MTKYKGFTLIELMIVVAIIGIISAISFPSYDRYMKKSGRADAKVGLMRIADLQERYYLQNDTYAANTTLLGLANPWITAEGYYSIAVDVGAGVNGFALTATAVAGETQINDLDCRTLSQSSIGVKTATDDGGADSTSKCW